MPLFTAAIAAVSAIGAWIGGLGAVGSFVLRTAVGIGLSYAAQALAGKKKPQASQPFAVQGAMRSGGVVPRSFMIGPGSTAGSLAYTNTWGNPGGTPNAYHVQVIALQDLPSKGLRELWINGEKVTIGVTPHPQGRGYPVTEYHKDGADYLWVKFYDGTQTAADPYLVEKFENDALWPYEDTRVGYGVAYIVVTAYINQTLFNGYAEVKAVTEGTKWYDPSKDDTAGGDGDQRYDVPATWGGDGDELPIVHAYNVLRGIKYAGEWFYGLQNVAAPQIPTASAIAAINVCRAQVTGPNGVEPQYRCGGEILVSSRIAETIEALLTACQGRIAEIGGFYKLHAGAPSDPVGEFTDGDILSTESQSFSPFFGLEDTINGMAGRYPEPAEGWNMKDAPERRNLSLEAKLGNRRFLADVDYSMVPFKGQVQRLMQSALDEASRARRHTISLPPRFQKYEPLDVLTFTSYSNGYEEKSFRIEGVVDKSNLDVIFDLTEVDPIDYDWDHDTQYVPPADGGVGISRPQPQPIIDWFAEPYTITDAGDNPRRAAIKLSWDGEIEDVRGVEYQVRLNGHAEIILQGSTDNFAAGSLIISQNLLADEEYEVRGRYIPASDRDTLWSDWLDVTTPNVGITPAELDATTRAILQRVDELTSWQNMVSSRLDQLAVAVIEDSSLLEDYRAQLYRGLGARFGSNKAAIDLLTSVVANDRAAVASILQSLTAVTGAGTATSLFRISAISDLDDGVLAAIEMAVAAGFGGAFAKAVLRMSALSTSELGLHSRIALAADQIDLIFTEGGEEIIVPAYGLQRAGVRNTPIVLGSPTNKIQIDAKQRHKSFATTLTSNAKILFPLGAWDGMEWIHTFTQDATGGRTLTYDLLSYIVEDPPVQPESSAFAKSVFRGTIISLSPAVATFKFEIGGETALGSTTQFSLNPPHPVTHQTIWDVDPDADGPMVIEGAWSGTITPLGDTLDVEIDIQAAGGPSGGCAVSLANTVQPTDSIDSSFFGPGITTLIAGAGKKSLTSQGNQAGFGSDVRFMTLGGQGGIAIGGTTNTNGASGDRAIIGGFSSNEVWLGGVAASPSGSLAIAQYKIASGDVNRAGVDGNDYGGGAQGAGVRNWTNQIFQGAGAGGDGARVKRPYSPSSAQQLLQDVAYSLVLGESGAPGNGSRGSGKRGGDPRLVITAL